MQNEDKNLMQEVNENQLHIKKRFESGGFFEDAKDWFYAKYASPYKSRFNLIILISILFFAISVMLISSIFNILGIKAKNGIVSLESEFEDEFVMQNIKQHYHNNEKNILRFVIENYVMYFESYDYDKFSIYRLNEQIRMVQRYSNKSVGEKFEKIAKNNYTAEIFAGFTRNSKIKSFEFYYPENNIKELVGRFLLPERTPNKVIVHLTSTLYKDGGRFTVKEEDRTIEIIFQYKPLDRDKNGNFEDLQFKVVSYNYLNI